MYLQRQELFRLFVIPPVVVGALQLIDSYIPLVWVSTVVSLLLLFITIQNSQFGLFRVADKITFLTNYYMKPRSG